jgi:hypothetical protein
MVRRENHTRRADPTLCSTVLEKTLLNRVQPAFCRETLDCTELRTVGLKCRNQTGVYELSIHQHSTRSTLALATTFLGPREVKILTQNVEQALHWRHLDPMLFAVHC